MIHPAGTPHWEVVLSPESEQDLLEIYSCTAASAGQEQAEAILDKLEQTILSPDSFPLRGNIPPELEMVGCTATVIFAGKRNAEYGGILRNEAE